MLASRVFVVRLAWIVSFTMLLSAWMPSLAHVFVTPKAGEFIEICSATGTIFMRLQSVTDIRARVAANKVTAPASEAASEAVSEAATEAATEAAPAAAIDAALDAVIGAAPDEGDASGRPGKSGTASSSMNCPCCSLHHGAPSLPPSGLHWTPPDALRFERPTLFLQAPRLLFAWAPALARGPPELS